MKKEQTFTVYNSIIEVIDGENYLDFNSFCRWTTKFKTLETWYKQMQKFGYRINPTFVRNHIQKIEELLYNQKDFKEKFDGYVHCNSIAFEGSAKVHFQKDHKINVIGTYS